MGYVNPSARFQAVYYEANPKTVAVFNLGNVGHKSMPDLGWFRRVGEP
jgi:hypothetical protein